MAYTPTDWQTGDVVTADKLNKIEAGVAQGNGIVPGTTDSGTDETIIDRSFDELTDMVANGTLPFLVLESNNGLALTPLLRLVYANSCYMAVFGYDNTVFYSLYSDTQMSSVEPELPK